VGVLVSKTSDAKRARRAEREERAAVLAVFARWAELALEVAHNAHNYVNTTTNELLTTKIGRVLDNEGDLVPAELKHYLSTTLKLPNWPTHAVITYTVDLVRDGAGPVLIGAEQKIKRMRHLSVTYHVPMRTTTAELRAIKDQWVQRSFPPDFLNLFFPDLDAVLVAIRAGPFQTSDDDDDDTTWTPVTTHFYIDHDKPPTAEKPKRSLLVDKDGRPL
jgi:hypothetical protein